MNSNQKEHIYCILFSDIKGYSTIHNDFLLNKLNHRMTSIFDQVKQDGVELLKTSGDGLMIGSLIPLPLAETALRLRDNFITTDWVNEGFAQDLMIRIGVHIGQAIVHYSNDGKVTDVIGVEVNTTARIEPITETNKVYCSKRFYDFLLHLNPQKIVGISKGVMQLAKNFGAMELYELRWNYETTSTVNSAAPASKSAIPMPTIKQEFTDKDRRDYLRSSFEAIKAYFNEAAKTLQSTNPNIDAEIAEISSTKFTCEIFRSGNSISRCKIWLGGFLSGKEEHISYVEGNFSVQDDTSLSVSAHVPKGANQLKLLTGFSGAGFGLPPIDETKPMPEQLAEYFWLRATQRLRS